MKSFSSQLTRRQTIRSLAGGGLLLPGLLSEMIQGATAGSDPLNPLAPKQPHYAPKAKRVIFLFMTGAVSHVDTFDPKPFLTKNHGQPHSDKRVYKGADWGVQTLRPERHSGERSFPPHRQRDRRHLRHQVDEEHQRGPFRRNDRHPHRIGDLQPAEHRLLGELRPGNRESEPALVHGDRARDALRGSPVLGLGLPARPAPGHSHCSRTRADCQHAPPRRDARDAGHRARTCSSISNRQHLKGREADTNLSARIRSFETAFGMQAQAPEAFDLSRESDATPQALRARSRHDDRFRMAVPCRPPLGRARRAFCGSD